jgi:hypothetical protein
MSGLGSDAPSFPYRPSAPDKDNADTLISC